MVANLGRCIDQYLIFNRKVGTRHSDARVSHTEVNVEMDSEMHTHEEAC